MNNNFNIAATKITDLIRVSTAAIWYAHENRFQVETIVFSDDPDQKFRMFIHGNHHGEIEQNDKLIEYARTFHRRIALKLNKKFNINFRIEKLRAELEYYSNLKGNSKLKWEYISQIENEIEILSKYLN